MPLQASLVELSERVYILHIKKPALVLVYTNMYVVMYVYWASSVNLKFSSTKVETIAFQIVLLKAKVNITKNRLNFVINEIFSYFFKCVTKVNGLGYFQWPYFVSLLTQEIMKIKSLKSLKYGAFCYSGLKF